MKGPAGVDLKVLDGVGGPEGVERLLKVTSRHVRVTDSQHLHPSFPFITTEVSQLCRLGRATGPEECLPCVALFGGEPFIAAVSIVVVLYVQQG